MHIRSVTSLVEHYMCLAPRVVYVLRQDRIFDKRIQFQQSTLSNLRERSYLLTHLTRLRGYHFSREGYQSDNKFTVSQVATCEISQLALNAHGVLVSGLGCAMVLTGPCRVSHFSSPRICIIIATNTNMGCKYNCSWLFQ